MGDKGRSDPNFWGGVGHYDEHGGKIGHSDLDRFGGYTPIVSVIAGYVECADLQA